MTYQRTTRRQRHLKYMRAKKERINTGLGHLFQLMRYLRMTWLARLVVRKPWHVADLYVDGRFLRALYIYPKESMRDRVARLNREAAKLVDKVDGVAAEPKRRGHYQDKKRSTR